MENVSYSLLQRYSATVENIVIQNPKINLSIYLYIYKYIDRVNFENLNSIK